MPQVQLRRGPLDGKTVNVSVDPQRRHIIVLPDATRWNSPVYMAAAADPMAIERMTAHVYHLVQMCSGPSYDPATRYWTEWHYSHDTKV